MYPKKNTNLAFNHLCHCCWCSLGAKQVCACRNSPNALSFCKVDNLHSLQDDLEALRHSSARDLARLANDLAKCEQERKHLADLVDILRRSGDGNETKVDSEKKLLEQRLEEAHMQLTDIKTSWSDKIASLETQVSAACDYLGAVFEEDF